MFKTELTPPIRALSALALMLPLCGVAAQTLPIEYAEVEYVTIPCTTAKPKDAVVLPNITWNQVKKIYCRYATTCTTASSAHMLFSATTSLTVASSIAPWLALTGTKASGSNMGLQLNSISGAIVKTPGDTYDRDGSVHEFTITGLSTTSTAYFQFGGAWQDVSWNGTADWHELVLYDGDDVELAHLVPCVDSSTGTAGFYDTVAKEFRTKLIDSWDDFIAGPRLSSALAVTGNPDEFGSPTPGYGSSRVSIGIPVGFSLTGGVEVEGEQGLWFFSAAGDARARYLNATFTGADGNPETIAGTSFARTITENSSVRWNFDEPKYRLVVRAATGGTVTVDGVTGTAITNWYPAGTAVQVSVSELPAGKVFGGWGGLEGDLPATITLTMDAPYDIYPLTPTVAIDRVQQRYPWNGLVDIDYTVSDVKGDPADYQLELSVTFADETRRMWSFTDFAPCDAPLSDGSHRITWNAPADGVERLARDASVSARLVYAPTTERDADYLIIDLSGGLDADAYPIKCVKGGDPRQFNSDRYKTDRLVLKRVSSGSFWMGEGTKVSGDYIGDVGPETASRHYVTLTRDYFLGLFPVTQRQHELVTGAKHYDVTPPGDCERPTKPVFDISWDAIMGLDTGKASFLTNLSARTSYHGIPVKGFSLPTEAQFEYALRAGTTNSYCYGSNATNDLPRFAYYSANKSARSEWGVAGYGHVGPLPPVGTFLPNAWGFYDMQSLVHEWCSDWYGEYPAGDEANPVVDPTGPATGTQKVLRSGSANEGAFVVNSGARFADAQTQDRISAMHAVYGFRIMKYVP